MNSENAPKEELRKIYELEEYLAEKRINRVTLPIIVFYALVIATLPLLTDVPYTNPNQLSNIVGIAAFLIYQLFNLYLIRKRKTGWLSKYLTMFFTVSIITIITFGYHYGTDYTHSTRTVTLTAYFLAVILSGQYQNPKICLFTALLVATEYTLHFAIAFLDGFPVYGRMETFRENILTWDILIVNLTFFTISGILMYLNSKRHHKLMINLRKSSEKLTREQKRAEYFENFDDLTHLPNLKRFKEKMDKQIVIAESRRQNFSLLCLGIDAFKNVNQLYGVNGGNILLREIGERLKKTYRDDDFLCRFMGDKFLILFPDLKSSENISRLIGKTRDAFMHPFIYEGNRIKITASGGFCSYPYDGDITDNLIERAESVMYEAKQSGKNSFRLFDSKRQTEVEQRIIIEKALEEAVDRGEFHLVYQPKVNKEGKIDGMESLIRWNHPDLGFISPELFISIAEKSGDIISIGYYVLEECCRQIKKWTELGLRARRITVNVSPFQFLHSKFASRVEDIMKEYSINPLWLGIELTESGMMIDEEECISRLSQLKDLGLTVSIDDFGKGYSSLSRLGNYPLDTLKIDKSFVDGLPNSSTSICLVRSIIDLAHNLDYDVIAEGVETQEQVDFLLKNGCSRFQGYFYFKPLRPEELEPHLIRD